MTHTYVTMNISRQAFDEIRRILLRAGYEHAIHERKDGDLIDMHGIAVEPEPLHVGETSLPAVVSMQGRGEIAELLLNMVAYNHGPSSARQWVDGVLQAIEVWNEARD